MYRGGRCELRKRKRAFMRSFASVLAAGFHPENALRLAANFTINDARDNSSVGHTAIMTTLARLRRCREDF